MAIGGNGPCPQEDLDFGYRTAEPHCYQKLLAGIRWVEAACGTGVVQARLQLVASGYRQELHLGDHHRAHADERQRDDVPRRLCAGLLPPSSLPSILFGSP